MTAEFPEDGWQLDFSAGLDDVAAPELYVDFGDLDNLPGLDGEGPEATFDTLYLLSKLERHSAPGRLELHNFAYLACLVSVYSGQPASGWGYSFSAVPPTLPFSPSIERALSDLEGAGFVTAVEPAISAEPQSDQLIVSQYRTTPDGHEELAFLSALSTFRPRLEFLDAASSTAILLSLPAVVSSMTLEPELVRAVRGSTNRLLLRDRDRGPLYRQFAALREVLGPDHSDLVVPASLYLRFLNEQAQQVVERTDE